MSSVNEIRNMRKLVAEAALRKRESDRMNDGVHMRDSIKSASARKRKGSRKATGVMGGMLSWNAICLAFVLLVNLLLAFRLLYSMAYPGFERSHLYARGEDFRKAEKFVNRFLNGNYSDVDYFKPEKAKAMWKTVPEQLAGFDGTPASSVEAISREDDVITYKATCVRGKEAAIIYLSPAGSSFHVSDVEIDRQYAMNTAK